MANCSARHHPTVRLSQSAAIFLHTLHIITCLLALTGNLVVIRVYSNVRFTTKLKSFLVNLAVADLVNGVLCIPFAYTEHVYGTWIFAPVMCPVAQFALFISIFVSAITLTAISVERSVAILKPFSKANEWLNTKTTLILVLIWTTAAIYAVTGSYATRVVPMTWNNETVDICRQNLPNGHFGSAFSFVNFFVTYAIPLLVMSILYTILMKKLVKRSPEISCSLNHFHFRNNNSIKTKTVKTLLVLVITFMVCMTPGKLLSFITLYESQLLTWINCSHSELSAWIKLSFSWLSTMHSVVNPIIYSFLCHNFRNQCITDWQILKRKMMSIIKR